MPFSAACMIVEDSAAVGVAGSPDFTHGGLAGAMESIMPMLNVY
nr:hypothetical protein [uncultured Desulfobulbus sp.]